MPNTTLDLPKLVAVLDAKITSEEISWRTAATRIGVSPSLLSRLRNGQRLDLDAYALIVRWLGMSADDFIQSDQAMSDRRPELASEVSALLRARPDLSDSDKSLLEEMFRASWKHVRRVNEARSGDE